MKIIDKIVFELEKREVTKCHRCKVDLFACEIRNDIEWCSECWDILYPSGKGVEVMA